MEVVRDKETGAVTIYLSKEESLNVLKDTEKSDSSVLHILNNKLWNA